MLVLSRKVGQSVVIPDYDITVTVVESQGGRVRLAIEAPREIAVYRDEILPRKMLGGEVATAPVFVGALASDATCDSEATIAIAK